MADEESTTEKKKKMYYVLLGDSHGRPSGNPLGVYLDGDLARDHADKLNAYPDVDLPERYEHMRYHPYDTFRARPAEAIDHG